MNKDMVAKVPGGSPKKHPLPESRHPLIFPRGHFLKKQFKEVSVTLKNLKFFVLDGTIISDPTCKATGLFPRMTEPVRLEFAFPPSWENTVKVAAFWSMMGNEYPPQVLKDGKSCIVPVEALQKAAFKVQILGKRNGKKTSTAKYTIYLKGGST